jgi:hypothetical protein
MGQIIGPVSEQTFSPSTGSGALYTIFPSNAQPESALSTRGQLSPSPEASYELARPPIQTSAHSRVHPTAPYSQPASPESTSSLYSPQPPYSSPPYASTATYASQTLYAPSSRPRPAPPALVPLEHLQSIQPPHRDPTDILYLQRLSLSSRSRDSSPAHSHPAAHVRTPYSEHMGEAVYRDAHRRYT